MADTQTPAPAGPPGDREAQLRARQEVLRAQNMAELNSRSRSAARPAPPSQATGPVARESRERDSRAANSAAVAMKMAKEKGDGEPILLDKIRGVLDGFEWLPDILKNVWVILGILVAVVLVVVVGFTMFGSPAASSQGVAVSTQVAPPPDGGGIFGFEVEGPGPVKVNTTITLAAVWITLLIIFGFAETVSRRERFALDFWAPILFVGVAVFRKEFSHDLWLSLQVVSATLLVVAVAFNENRPTSNAKGGGAWSTIFNLVTGLLDMTPLYLTAALMIALGYAKWKLLPYPTWIDPMWVWVALIVGGLFEVSRAPLPTLIAIGLGAVAGFLFDPWLTMAAALIIVTMGAIFASKGWLPTTGHAGSGTVEAMGRSLNVIIRWDVILLATIAYFIVAISAHGNIVVYHMARLAGGG